jgi:hypothetical protein
MAEKTIIGEGGMLRARSPYDQTFVMVADLPNPVTVTLPGAATYVGPELRVELNGQGLEPGTGVTLGGGTTVDILQDLKTGDRIRFVKVHNP